MHGTCRVISQCAPPTPNPAAASLFEHDLFRKPVSTFRDHALGFAADELQQHGTPMRPRPVLDQIKALPGAERKRATLYRDMERNAIEHALDVSGHVVGA